MQSQQKPMDRLEEYKQDREKGLSCGPAYDHSCWCDLIDWLISEVEALRKIADGPTKAELDVVDLRYYSGIYRKALEEIVNRNRCKCKPSTQWTCPVCIATTALRGEK